MVIGSFQFLQNDYLPFGGFLWKFNQQVVLNVESDQSPKLKHWDAQEKEETLNINKLQVTQFRLSRKGFTL